jgi:carbon storage regulator
MLVLTRKEGENLVINGDVIVTVVSCGNGRVRLGVKAPQHVSVDRGEIHERKMEFIDVEVGTPLDSVFARVMAKPAVRECQETVPLY